MSEFDKKLMQTPDLNQERLKTLKKLSASPSNETNGLFRK